MHYTHKQLVLQGDVIFKERVHNRLGEIYPRLWLDIANMCKIEMLWKVEKLDVHKAFKKYPAEELVHRNIKGFLCEFKEYRKFFELTDNQYADGTWINYADEFAAAIALMVPKDIDLATLHGWDPRAAGIGGAY